MLSGAVVVGVDGGPDSVRALEWASEYAPSIGAPLVALTVFEPATMAGPYAMAGWEDPAELEKAARATLTDTVERALGAGAEIDLLVQSGQPAEALIAASDEAKAIVVGSRGRGGFTGLLLGSVSQQVIAHARCPVVVLPRETGAER